MKCYEELDMKPRLIYREHRIMKEIKLYFRFVYNGKALLIYNPEEADLEDYKQKDRITVNQFFIKPMLDKFQVSGVLG